MFSLFENSKKMVASIERKLEKHEKEFAAFQEELALAQAKTNSELGESNLTIEELEHYFSNQENFTEAFWEEFQAEKKELEERLAMERQSRPEVSNTAKVYQELQERSDAFKVRIISEEEKS